MVVTTLRSAAAAIVLAGVSGCALTDGSSAPPTAPPGSASAEASLPPSRLARIRTPGGLVVEYPAGWHATLQADVLYAGEGVLVTSYPVDGDGYVDARDRRPPGGVMLMIMELEASAGYRDDPMVIARPARIGLGRGGSFEGLGQGYRVAFRDSGHVVVTYAALDPHTTRADREAAVAALNSIRVGATGDRPRTSRAAARALARLRRGWTALPSPPALRHMAAEVWTGRELIAWSGETGDFLDLHAHGSAFDLARGRWRAIPEAPISSRSEAGAVWTGSEMLVWGGTWQGDGAAYDPVARRWRLLADGPLDPRAPVSTVWTGDEMLVWGDASRGAARTDGAAYDPAGDRWRRLSDAPFPLNAATAVWTGREMIVVGAQLDGNNSSQGRPARALAYRPAADRWRVLRAPRLSPQASTAVWDGRRVVAWDYTLRARAYDPSTDAWTDLPRLPFRLSECFPEGTALGRAVLAHHCDAVALLDGEPARWTRVETPSRGRLWHLAGSAGGVAFFLGRRFWALRP